MPAAPRCGGLRQVRWAGSAPEGRGASSEWGLGGGDRQQRGLSGAGAGMPGGALGPVARQAGTALKPEKCQPGTAPGRGDCTGHHGCHSEPDRQARGSLQGHGPFQRISPLAALRASGLCAAYFDLSVIIPWPPRGLFLNSKQPQIHLCLQHCFRTVWVYSSVCAVRVAHKPYQ